MAANGDSIFNPAHRVVYQDMRQPLSHYFIATSHNTYLTKDQLKSKSSVDAYINAFKRGCKCVELDCWDGPDNEPIVYHGHTLTSKIYFKDVITAVRDYAFCVNRFPVILSFENHCSTEQQKVMARHLKTILGKMLHTLPVSDDRRTLPSPAELQGYVLVKAKRLKPESANYLDDADFEYSDDDELDVYSYAARRKNDLADSVSIASEDADGDTDSTSSSGRRKTLDDLVQSMKTLEVFKKRNADKSKEHKVAEEFSELVTYCQAVGFQSFEHSRNNTSSHHMSSFGERKATKLASEDPHGFLQHNQRHLSRIYPAGFRIDSSNYDPMTFWMVGCQLVALNYQTPCFEMQVNQGLFQDNGGCGYVLKPAFMRSEIISFSPQQPLTPQYEVTVKGIRGYHIDYKRPKFSKAELKLIFQIKTAGVQLDSYCLRTESLNCEGDSPVWNDELQFRVHVPQLTVVQFAVLRQLVFRQASPETCGSFGNGLVRNAIKKQVSKLANAVGAAAVEAELNRQTKQLTTRQSIVGQYTLPFSSIVPGNHKIFLLNKYSEPLMGSYLQANVTIRPLP